MKKKKADELEEDPEAELTAQGGGRPVRNRGNARKSASHSSSKRKKNKSATRKGNTTGGIHQRGDKRVLR